VRVGERG
jgi:hypothetical protein